MRFKLPLALLALVIISIGLVLMLRSVSKRITPTPAPTTTTSQSGTAYINGIPVETRMEEQAPDAFVSVFYTWYVTHPPGAPGSTQYTQFMSVLKQALTPDFVAQYEIIAKQTGVNPLTLSEFYYASWPSNIRTSVLSTSGTTAHVSVSLGTGPQLKRLDVSVVRTDSGWRIVSVASEG